MPPMGHGVSATTSTAVIWPMQTKKRTNLFIWAPATLYLLDQCIYAMKWRFFRTAWNLLPVRASDTLFTNKRPFHHSKTCVVVAILGADFTEYTGSHLL